MPSPNIPTLDSAIVYPGTVLFEGTNASEARGTTRPFELVGAPWVEAERFADEMNARRLPGVHFRPAVFEPTFQKHAKKPCGGCQIHVLDRTTFRPVLTGVALIDAIKAAGPKDFAWRRPPYEYEHEIGFCTAPPAFPEPAWRSTLLASRVRGAAVLPNSDRLMSVAAGPGMRTRLQSARLSVKSSPFDRRSFRWRLLALPPAPPLDGSS